MRLTTTTDDNKFVLSQELSLPVESISELIYKEVEPNAPWLSSSLKLHAKDKKENGQDESKAEEWSRSNIKG